MKILADLNISPATVQFLKGLGHNVVRINEILKPTSPDSLITETAAKSDRVILTQDLDFSEIIALSGNTKPSLITLRLSSSRIEFVNSILEKVLPGLESDARQGAIITVEDARIRIRKLPV